MWQTYGHTALSPLATWNVDLPCLRARDELFGVLKYTGTKWGLRYQGVESIPSIPSAEQLSGRRTFPAMKPACKSVGNPTSVSVFDIERTRIHPPS